MTAPTGFFVTDLDGTLASNVTSIVHDEDRAALQRLGDLGVIRVVATGRSLTSLRKVLLPDFPIDYVVFSTGAGIARWRNQALGSIPGDGEMLLARNLKGPALREIALVLATLGADFMVHHPVPDNHHFHWSQRNDRNADFARRLSHHAECCVRWDDAQVPASASQFLVVDAVPGSATLHYAIERGLPSYAVTRATSPLDGVTTWTEIFAEGVTKGSGCEWLARLLGVPASAPHVAVGNDYNDLALLQWASRAFVTEDAPEEVRACGELVPSAAAGAVRAAISRAFS